MRSRRGSSTLLRVRAGSGLQTRQYLLNLRKQGACGTVLLYTARLQIAKRRQYFPRAVGVAASLQQFFEQTGKCAYFDALQGEGKSPIFAGKEGSGAKIAKHGIAGGAVQDVVRVQIAVDDAPRVQVLDGGGDAEGDADGRVRGEGGIGGVDVARA